MTKQTKKINQIWALLARNVSIDQQTNVVSVFGVIEEIHVQIAENIQKELEQKKVANLKFQEPMNLVSLFKIGDDVSIKIPLHLQIKLIDPFGKQIGLFPAEIVPQGKKRVRTVMQMHGLPVTVSGEYNFVFESKNDGGNWEQQLSVPVEIFLSPKS